MLSGGQYSKKVESISKIDIAFLEPYLVYHSIFFMLFGAKIKPKTYA